MTSKDWEEGNQSESSLVPPGNANHTQFPWKLHTMLRDCEREGTEFVACWMPSGKAFRVNNDRQGIFLNHISKY